MYPGAAGNLNGMQPIPGTTGIVPNIAKGESPYKEEKDYDKGWPPKPTPKVAAAQEGEGLSFQNLLGGSNLSNATADMNNQLVAGSYGQPSNMPDYIYESIQRQYNNPRFMGTGGYSIEDKKNVINWNRLRV
tara:strand:- start:1427 stop:1822 length:396 start_codon:yes stop_codon:yes gene_type:complete